MISGSERDPIGARRTGTLAQGAFACVCLAALCSVGCRPLFGLEEHIEGNGGEATTEGDGGSAASSEPWWVETNAHGCRISRAPSRDDKPRVEDALSKAPFFLALSHVRIGAVDESYGDDDDAWKQIGLDLDGRCTSSPTCEGVRESKCVPAATIADGDGCLDNALGEQMRYAANLVPTLTEAELNCELFRGGFNILFKISDYNGKADDPRVRLDVYTSVGLPQHSWECHENGELRSDWQDHQKWWERERVPTEKPWRITADSLAVPGSDCAEDIEQSDVALPAADLCDRSAFVRSGYLFATFRDAEFWLNGRDTPATGFRTVLARGVLLGKLITDLNDRWGLEDATVVGVTTVDDMLDAFQQAGFCASTNPGAHAALTDTLKISQDVPLEPDAPEDQPCNALSIAWEIRAIETGGGHLEEPMAPDGGGLAVAGSCGPDAG